MLVREALQAGLPIRAQVILAGFDREEKIRSPAISSDPRTVESNADSWSSPLTWRPLEDLNDIDESFAGFRLTDGMWAIVFFYVELDVGWSARIRRPCIVLRENGRREKQKQGHNFHVAPYVCRRCLAGAKESLSNETCADVLGLHTSLKRQAKGLMEQRLEEMENSGAEEGGSGNGEDPGEDDATGNPPAHGGKAAGGADADDGARNGVRGADRDAKVCRSDEGESACGFRGEAAEGIELGDALAHGFDNAPTTSHGAAAHGQMAAHDDPVGHVVSLQQAASDEGRGDNAHAFLSVIGAVTEAVGGSGKELQAAEPAVDLKWALFADDPACGDGYNDAKEETDDGREEDEKDGFGPAAQDKGTETCAGHGSTTVAAHKSVRRTGGEAEDESDEIPGDGPEESRQKNLLIDHLNVDHAFSDGLGDGSAENEGGDEVPESGPGDGAERCQYARGDNRGDGIGGVVPAIREFEREGEEDDDEKEGEASHSSRVEIREGAERFLASLGMTVVCFSLKGVKRRHLQDQALLRMTPSMTLATSSHLSTAVSMTS